jgi:hypothetical protein
LRFFNNLQTVKGTFVVSSKGRVNRDKRHFRFHEIIVRDVAILN